MDRARGHLQETSDDCLRTSVAGTPTKYRSRLQIRAYRGDHAADVEKQKPACFSLREQSRLIGNKKIRTYIGAMKEHHRYRSWEHCYCYFHKAGSSPRRIIAADPARAALVLGFYLASWGMYRGSSFLIEYDYTIHREVIVALTAQQFVPLWRAEFGSRQDDEALLPVIDSAIDTIQKIYRPFALAVDSGEPTDTLVTKVLLGTFGCLPACDTYFIAGFKHSGFQYSYLNPAFVRRVFGVCRKTLSVLRAEQSRIKSLGGIHYPLMKLLDMHFWQTGYDLES